METRVVIDGKTSPPDPPSVMGPVTLPYTHMVVMTTSSLRMRVRVRMTTTTTVTHQLMLMPVTVHPISKSSAVANNTST